MSCYSLEEIQAALLKPAPNQGKMQHAAELTSDLFRFINAQNLNWDRIHFRCVDGDTTCNTNEIEFSFPVSPPSPTEAKTATAPPDQSKVHKIQHLKQIIQQAQLELRQLEGGGEVKLLQLLQLPTVNLDEIIERRNYD